MKQWVAQKLQKITFFNLPIDALLYLNHMVEFDQPKK